MSTRLLRGTLSSVVTPKISHGVGHEFDLPNIITITVTSAQRTPPLGLYVAMYLSRTSYIDT
eukprot:scaffold84846_cov73-Attheya_sp.AAC.1